MAKEKLSGRALTTHLREIMASVHTTDLLDGEMVLTTKSERLAEILCERALGWEDVEEVPDSSAKKGYRSRKVKHKPEKWAIVMVYERLEGKAPTALEDKTPGITVTDRVSELAVERINDLTEEETQDGSDS